MDQQIYKLVKYLLNMGDEQLQSMKNQPYKSSVTGKPLSHYSSVKSNTHFKQELIIHHEHLIHSVMMTIKPGLCSICTKQFTKDMTMTYLDNIKNTEADKMKEQSANKVRPSSNDSCSENSNNDIEKYNKP